MAFYTDCISCSFGNHDGHNEVIWQNGHDGDFCPCDGNCNVRLVKRQAAYDERKRLEQLARLIEAKNLLESHGYQVVATSEAGESDLSKVELPDYILASRRRLRRALG